MGRCGVVGLLVAVGALAMQHVATGAPDLVHAVAPCALPAGTPTSAPVARSSGRSGSTAYVGNTLTIELRWRDGTCPSTVELQWYRCPAESPHDLAERCERIDGATTASYRITSQDLGRFLHTNVIASNDLGTTARPAGIAHRPGPVGAPFLLKNARGAFARPRLSAVQPRVGSTLTTTTGSWDGDSITYSYRWLRCRPTPTFLVSCVTWIEGATGRTYRVTRGDVGWGFMSVVTARNRWGAVVAHSWASQQVKPTG